MSFGPYYIERGRQSMATLDRDVAMRQREDALENMKDFVDRIWLPDDEIREKKEPSTSGWQYMPTRDDDYWTLGRYYLK